MGTGLVWGWLIGSLEGRIRNPWRTIPAIIIASLVLSLQAFLFQDFAGTGLFWVSMSAAMVIHLFWRRKLRCNFGSGSIDGQEVFV
jgi:hypothetical protein